MNTPQLDIRKTQESDAAALLDIYAHARAFMRSRGNLHQWSDAYPSLGTIKSDMAEGNSYVVLRDGKVVATFFLRIGDDPTYAYIEGGQWLNDKPYGVIHRVASDGSVKGIMHIVLDFCFGLIDNIRIDTHADNHVMRESLQRYGFKYCGIIYLASGDQRLAYQLTKVAK